MKKFLIFLTLVSLVLSGCAISGIDEISDMTNEFDVNERKVVKVIDSEEDTSSRYDLVFTMTNDQQDFIAVIPTYTINGVDYFELIPDDGDFYVYFNNTDTWRVSGLPRKKVITLNIYVIGRYQEFQIPPLKFNEYNGQSFIMDKGKKHIEVNASVLVEEYLTIQVYLTGLNIYR